MRQVTITMMIDVSEYDEALATPKETVELVAAMIRRGADFPDETEIKIKCDYFEAKLIDIESEDYENSSQSYSNQ